MPSAHGGDRGSDRTFKDPLKDPFKVPLKDRSRRSPSPLPDHSGLSR